MQQRTACLSVRPGALSCTDMHSTSCFCRFFRTHGRESKGVPNRKPRRQSTSSATRKAASSAVSTDSEVPRQFESLKPEFLRGRAIPEKTGVLLATETGTALEKISSTGNAADRIRPEKAQTYREYRDVPQVPPIGPRSNFVLKHKPHRRIGRSLPASGRMVDPSAVDHLPGLPDTIPQSSKIQDRHQKSPLEKGVFGVEPPVPGGTWHVSSALFRPPRKLLYPFESKCQSLN